MSSFGARRRARRQAARERVLARVAEPMTATQRAFDPLGQDAAIDPWGVAALALLGALAVHGGIYGIGAAFGALGDDDAPRERPTKIVVRERPPEPPPPPQPEPVAVADVPEPAAVEPAPPPPEPKIKPKAEPPPEPPPEPAAKPPPRIVGIDLEGTSEGGTGGSFGVGNTNDGKTGDRAVDPRKVVRGGTGDGKEPSKPAPRADPPPNKAATNIPTAKAKLVMPKRKKPVVPGYPETLKSQGIEADVPVVVSIDERGKVTEVKIAKSSSYPAFDEAARKAALAEVFEPATRDGVAVPYTISYTYRFRLEDQ